MLQCKLPHCETRMAPMAVLCRRHWRQVPPRLRLSIERQIRQYQVDPRRNQNPPKRWRTLVLEVVAHVLESQGKKRQAEQHRAAEGRIKSQPEPLPKQP